VLAGRNRSAFDVSARKLSLVRAGHLPLIHYSAAAKSCRHIVPRGLGLENGPLFKNELEETNLTFGGDDVFIFYTDGLTEAHDTQGHELETGWVEKIVQENGHASAIDLREKIMAQLQQLTAAESPQDEMTLIVVRAKG
jgi:sigma-B regulation protein RsbU (phosphoserine phosphatase)